MAFRMPSKPLNGFAVQIPTGPPTLSVYTSAPSTTRRPMPMAWHGAKKDDVPHRKPHASWLMHLLQSTMLLHPRTCPSLPEQVSILKDFYHDAHPILEITLGALYDPRLLYDYGGPLFAHKLAKLKQRNIVAKDGLLVPPWSEYEHLRTGTVVLMRVNLHTYNIPISSYKTRKVLKT